MRHLSRPVSLAAGLMLAATLAGPTLASSPAAANPGPSASGGSIHRVVTRSLVLDDAECAALDANADGRGRTRSSTATCAATITLEVSATRLAPIAGDTLVMQTGTTCTTTWVITSERATVQSIFGGFFWSASANATGYGDSCGRVMWTSVTCDQHGIGYAVHVDWCGAYPGRWTWYGYRSTNFGLNITVSAVANGTPIAWTHGARNGFNPYTGSQYGFFYW